MCLLVTSINRKIQIYETENGMYNSHMLKHNFFQLFLCSVTCYGQIIFLKLLQVSSAQVIPCISSQQMVFSSYLWQFLPKF